MEGRPFALLIVFAGSAVIAVRASFTRGPADGMNVVDGPDGVCRPRQLPPRLP
ncbi:MAG: hypothetical protein ACYDB7_10915 [Mycobacteriales bacterium]